MTTEFSAIELALRHKVEASELVLEGIEAELRAADERLAALAERARQYDLLATICDSLEELDDQGASHLFWTGPEENRHDQLDYARRNIEEFGEQVARVERDREALIERAQEQNIELDYLHYDLQDLIEQEESRRDAWLVEREADELQNHNQVMPWSRGCEEDRRSRRSVSMSLAASLAVAFLVSVIAVPLTERPEDATLPERVASLVRQEQAPPPPPPVAEPEIPEQDLPEPDPELVEELPDEPIPESVDQPALAAAEPDTREQVQTMGILAFRDSFADRATLRPTAQLGSQARVTSAGQDAAGRPERMMVSTSAPGSSGGINLASISRDVGGGGQGIDGVAVSRVASSIGSGDGPNRPLASGAAAGRTDEEIQIVFDRYKAALYRLYNRELRKDPTLRGQLVLQMTIEPDGSVSLCRLHSSDMNAPALADQVISRVSTFDFGAKEDIVAVTIIYPIDFLPAA